MKNEMLFLWTMQKVSELVDKGLVTKDEYKEMQEKMIEKYSPGKEATFVSNRLDCAGL